MFMDSPTIGPVNKDRSTVESAEQVFLFIRAEKRVPLCGPQHPFPDRPAAVIRIIDESTASVCAWHDGGRGRVAANKWCEEYGYRPTHTCCEYCFPSVKDGTWEELRP